MVSVTLISNLKRISTPKCNEIMKLALLPSPRPTKQHYSRLKVQQSHRRKAFVESGLVDQAHLESLLHSHSRHSDLAYGWSNLEKVKKVCGV